MNNTEHKILLIISGSIAAYKTPELIRLLKKDHYNITCILTEGGKQFVTPLTLASLSNNPVYTDIFSLKDETEMGHIRLARETDLVVVAPASANIIAKMATGLADDLASTLLLATDKPVMIVPAMNTYMWEHKAIQRNVRQLKEDGISIVGPAKGDMACGENGYGRMVEIEEIASAIKGFFKH